MFCQKVPSEIFIKEALFMVLITFLLSTDALCFVRWFLRTLAVLFPVIRIMLITSLYHFTIGDD